VAEKLCSYFKSLGADQVYDLKLCEDIALVEQAKEFEEKYQSGDKKTLMTSACPGDWRFITTFYLDQLI